MSRDRWQTIADVTALATMGGWVLLGVGLVLVQRGLGAVGELAHVGLLHAVGAPVPPPSPAVRAVVEDVRREAA